MYPDSSQLDNVIGDDSLLLSAIKNDAKERFNKATRTWKSIVTCIFGNCDDFSQHETTLLLQQDGQAPQENTENVTNLNVQQVPLNITTPNLQHDLQVLQEKIEQVMNGGDMNAPFPVNHSENFLHFQEVEEFEEDWKSELDHLEGCIASKAVSVTRVDWKNPAFLCHMPHYVCWPSCWHRPSAETGTDVLPHVGTGTQMSPYWHSMSKIDLVPIRVQVLIEVETSV